MRLLTAKEVSEGLCVPLSRVYELARTGVIPVVRLGERQVRFNEEAIRDWIARGGHAPENKEEHAKQQ